MLLGPKQVISPCDLPRVDVGVEPPSNQKLRFRHFIHANIWLLDLGSCGLDSALWGTGPLRSFLVAEPLGARVTAGIRTPGIGTGATTYDTQTQTHEKSEKGYCKDQGQNQMKHVKMRLGGQNKVIFKSAVVLGQDAEVKIYICSSRGSTAPGWHGSTVPRAEVNFYFHAPSGSTAPEDR